MLGPIATMRNIGMPWRKEIAKPSLPNAIQLAYQCLELAIMARENWIKKVKEAMHPMIYEPLIIRMSYLKEMDEEAGKKVTKQNKKNSLEPRKKKRQEEESCQELRLKREGL